MNKGKIRINFKKKKKKSTAAGQKLKRKRKNKVNSQKRQWERMFRFQNLKAGARKNPKTEYSSCERQSLQNIIHNVTTQETDKAIHKIHGLLSFSAHDYKENGFHD